MKTVTVTASKTYEVLVGSGLLSGLGREVSKVSKAQKIAIVTDTNVQPLYLAKVETSLKDAGFANFSVFTISAGETSKNGENFLKLLNFLAQNHLTRSDCVVALGGGVVGDLTGFAAASYLRGIAYIQVPTTLLAAVDSSVGGKTAIDLDAGKNLAGAFYQPSLVLCDIDTLNTLPEDIFRDGCAEVIKYGVLYDKELFSHLAARGLDFDREETICRCVELKRDVVAIDEHDHGARQKLNLGHTVGHGVEAQSNYTVPHGQAVAIGMAIVARAGCALQICSEQTKNDILRVLQTFSLPTDTPYSAKELTASALSDKKRSGDTVNLIVPEEIGSCAIRPTPIENLEAFIESGL